jgi:hypothetical protein
MGVSQSDVSLVSSYSCDRAKGCTGTQLFQVPPQETKPEGTRKRARSSGPIRSGKRTRDSEGSPLKDSPKKVKKLSEVSVSIWSSDPDEAERVPARTHPRQDTMKTDMVPTPSLRKSAKFVLFVVLLAMMSLFALFQLYMLLLDSAY